MIRLPLRKLSDAGDMCIELGTSPAGANHAARAGTVLYLRQPGDVYPAAFKGLKLSTARPARGFASNARRPINATIERLADVVADWEHVTYEGQPIAAHRELVLELLRIDDVRDQVTRALRDAGTVGLVIPSTASNESRACEGGCP